MRRRSAAAAITLAAVGALAGCGAHTTGPHDPSSTTGSPSLAPTPTPTPSPTQAPRYVPTAPAGTPLGAGERVWAAFSRSDLPYAAWWAQLKPMLSAAARAVYVYDDPSDLPFMTVTGQVRVAAKAPAEPHYTVEVIVPTSKGAFALDLERHTLASPWLLYAIKFPPTVQ
ncbi:MAG: hypothetical protein JWR52_451 [Marmoricola sp.]|nr:hypothetical protein [Marmoricola sp.]